MTALVLLALSEKQTNLFFDICKHYIWFLKSGGILKLIKDKNLLQYFDSFETYFFSAAFWKSVKLI